MRRLPPELVETVVFCLDDFYTYVALGFRRRQHVNRLMWMSGGPGVVLSDTLCQQQELLESSKGGHICDKDMLRVLNFLRDQYNEYLPVEIALTKAVLTKSPRLLRRVCMVWDARHYKKCFVMASMAAAGCNFWWAVDFLATLNPSHSHRRIRLVRNIYHLAHGELDKIDYGLRPPLRDLPFLLEHPDPARLAAILTDDTLHHIRRRISNHNSLLKLAAHLGKYTFLRQVILSGNKSGNLDSDGLSLIPHVDLPSLLARLVRGLHPKTAALLLVEFAPHMTNRSTEDLLYVYSELDASQYLDEIEMVANVEPYVNARAWHSRRQKLEIPVAREDVASIRRNLQQYPEDADYVLELLVTRNRLHLLPYLLEPRQPSYLRNASTTETVGDADRGGDHDGNGHGFIPMALFEREKATIVGALMEREQLGDVYLRQLGFSSPLIKGSPFMLDVFRLVKDATKYKMLQAKLVTDEDTIKRMAGLDSSPETVVDWTRFLQYAPFLPPFTTDEAGHTIGSVDESKDETGTSLADLRPHYPSPPPRDIAKVLCQSGCLQDWLPGSVAISTHKVSDEQDSNHAPHARSWKEFIDWILFNMPNSTLQMWTDENSSVGSRKPHLFVNGSWGLWYHCTDMNKALLSASEMPEPSSLHPSSSSSNAEERSIIFIDPLECMDLRFGGLGIGDFKSFIQTLDPSLYCRFLMPFLKSGAQRVGDNEGKLVG